jgi:hypothetical protein
VRERDVERRERERRDKVEELPRASRRKVDFRLTGQQLKPNFLEEAVGS